MRPIARGMLLLYVFCIPWEYSLDFGDPVGNIARVMGLLLVLVALLASVFAVSQGDRLRPFGLMQYMVLALFVWFSCSCFWSIDIQASLDKLRGFAQEMMIVWMVWEFARRSSDFRMLVRAFVAGSVVLAILSLTSLGSIEAFGTDQIRLAAPGQDPNDVARYLDLALPMAAMLLKLENRWPGRLLALGFLPLGAAAALLTASRSGFLAGIVALGGCLWILGREHRSVALAGLWSIPIVAAGLWFAVPRAIFERFATIPEQVLSSDLNQRWNIWIAGGEAFVRTPLLGSGVGTFAAASDLAPIDTAHNTLLSILVGGGLCALFLAASLVAVAVSLIARMRGGLRLGMAITFVVLAMTSLVSTVEESRSTWLLLALVAAVGSFGKEDWNDLARSAPSPTDMHYPASASPFDSEPECDGMPVT